MAWPRTRRHGLARLNTARVPAATLERDLRGSPARSHIPDHVLGEVVAALIDAGAPPSEALARVATQLASEKDPRAAAWSDAWARVQGLVAPEEAFASAAPRPAVTHLAGGRRVLRTRGGEPERFLDDVTGALVLAGECGLPPGDLVRDCARDLRRARAVRSGRRLARLPVLLVLPMGLCLLPAAVLLGVAPVVLGLLGGLRG